MKQKVEILEKVSPKTVGARPDIQENAALKKSLFELSTRFNMVSQRSQPFPLNFMDDPGSLLLKTVPDTVETELHDFEASGISG